LAVIFTTLFFVLMYVNLWFADRVAPRFRPSGPEEEVIERYYEVVGHRQGLVRLGIAGLFALIAGVGTAGQWESWILFTNHQEFGLTDPLFNTDIGFYVFQLPFLSFVTSWLFGSLVTIFLITAAAHYVNGGIRVQTAGERATPAVKGHLSVLLAVMALVRAAGYWLDRYELTFSTRGHVDGALYTDVNAQLPAIHLLLLISVSAAVLFVVNIWRRGWVLPVVAVGVWGFVSIVVSGIYPAVIQRFQVEPAESSREAEYIARNIEATRYGMGLHDRRDPALRVQHRPDRRRHPQQPGDGPQHPPARSRGRQRHLPTTPGRAWLLRLQRPRRRPLHDRRSAHPGRDRHPRAQPWRSPHRFVGGRDPRLHPRLRAGHGPGQRHRPVGRPNFVVGDLPVRIDDEVPFDLDRPEVYFGENLPGYAIVGHRPRRGVVPRGPHHRSTQARVVCRPGRSSVGSRSPFASATSNR
jgi:uncharacterized protein